MKKWNTLKFRKKRLEWFLECIGADIISIYIMKDGIHIGIRYYGHWGTGTRFYEWIKTEGKS